MNLGPVIARCQSSSRWGLRFSHSWSPCAPTAPCALVRCDAFGDPSGQLSFSAAILDDHGDGLVISSVHALGESRPYAKAVIEGLCHTTLTQQEQQALAAAHTGKVLS